MTTKLARLPKQHVADTTDRVTMIDADAGLIAVIPNPGKHVEVIP